MVDGLNWYTINKAAMNKMNNLSRFFKDEKHYERLFFVFLTLVMGGIYIIALNTSVTLHPVWKLVLFTVLMIVYIGLYWVSPWVFLRIRWLPLYILLQACLAFSLGMMSGVVGIIFGLYPGLIGLMVGAPVKRFQKLLIISFILLVSALNFGLLDKFANMGSWTLGTIPVVIFVCLYVYLYVRQAEARERAQELLKDLEVANRQLSEYAAQVEDLTLATERQRMARELHDTLSQGLAGLILQLEAVNAHLEDQRVERARVILQQSMAKARGTLSEARRAIDHLRAPVEQDLAERVRQECAHFTASTGIPCESQVNIHTDLPEPIEDSAGKVIAEALANIARHARAGRASVRIEANGKVLAIEIYDDGVGFDPALVEAGHYGLVGMRERIRLAGGHLDILSRPGEGTRVMAEFPLEEFTHA
jgi:NarL family two-component system sensor histidine kinase YdfH